MKLEKGKKYDINALVPIGEMPIGYNVWHYFDEDCVYLGPDDDGIEPEFDD